MAAGSPSIQLSPQKKHWNDCLGHTMTQLCMGAVALLSAGAAATSKSHCSQMHLLATQVCSHDGCCHHKEDMGL